MREILRKKKWQLLCPILATALTTSVSFNIIQIFSASVSSDSSVEDNLSGNVLQSSSSGSEVNFTFRWGADSQRVIQGTFCMKISMRWHNEAIGNETVEYLTMEIQLNDDDYDDWDYVGLVFDTNQNGYIEAVYDYPYALYANNMTQPSVLWYHGFLGFAEIRPVQGPHKVLFTPERGYTFIVQFPSSDGYNRPWNPIPLLKRGCNNPMHICFYDRGEGKVFVRFLFYVPEEM